MRKRRSSRWRAEVSLSTPRVPARRREPEDV